MARQAQVRSLEAVRQFRAELASFADALRFSLDQLAHAGHQGVAWMETDRMVYWPAEVRRASDRLSEARISLERCLIAIRPEDRAPCTEEKKAFERAQQRLRFCDEQVGVTRSWLQVVRQQNDGFRTALAKATHTVDVELPAALRRMDEIIAKLEAYV
jgi:hypothetical protein